MHSTKRMYVLFDETAELGFHPLSHRNRVEWLIVKAKTGCPASDLIRENNYNT